MRDTEKKKSKPAQWVLMGMVIGFLTGGPAHGRQTHTAPGGKPWSLHEIVQADGRLHVPVPSQALCVGWKLMLDPMLRARFVHIGGSDGACRARTGGRGASYWDDQLVLPGVAGQVRAFVGGGDAVYVDSRFSFTEPGLTVSGILKWEAETGRWQVVGNAPEADGGSVERP